MSWFSRKKKEPSAVELVAENLANEFEEFAIKWGASWRDLIYDSEGNQTTLASSMAEEICTWLSQFRESVPGLPAATLLIFHRILQQLDRPSFGDLDLGDMVKLYFGLEPAPAEFSLPTCVVVFFAAGDTPDAAPSRFCVELFLKLVKQIQEHDQVLRDQAIVRVMREGFENYIQVYDEPIASGTEDPHQLLGLDEDCSEAELRTAYRAKVALWHPDKLQSAAPELQDIATAKLAQLNEAYRFLSAQRSSGSR